MNTTLLAKAKQIKLAVFDVDGVLSEGHLYFTSHDEEIKAFNAQDGLGIKLLQNSGIQTAIITVRKSPLVEKRAKGLGITHIEQGQEDKLTVLTAILAKLNLSLDQVAYLGDDLPDLAAIRRVGLGMAVANAHDFVKQHADGVTCRKGGDGAVREFCELIMDAQGTLDAAQAAYL
ncbi:MAG: HAD family hydrolase [Endozoicomonadaceae bacterium]|nr:HAD family hydrolase [Endozoicomonadaceae bacterium]